MIPQCLPTWQSLTWQQQLADTVRDGDELCRLLQLDPKAFAATHLPRQHPELKQFPLRVPRAFVARMRTGDLQDPLLLQVLPQAAEAQVTPGFDDDPLKEKGASPTPGIVHKYHGRVLMMLTSACAIHCRYCFRRHFPYQDHRLNREQWQQSLDYLRANDDISEVIFSGGDPLALGDEHLSWLVEQIEAIAHITTLRIHSRLPIVIPARIDDACLAWLNRRRLQIVMVLHANHPQELDNEVAACVSKLKTVATAVLNQSVLLKNVNDHPQTLARLSQTLFKMGVLPYYLHLLDRVKGARHFWLDDDAALSLHRQLQDALPGYLVPKLVRETPHAAAKTVLG